MNHLFNIGILLLFKKFNLFSLKKRQKNIEIPIEPCRNCRTHLESRFCPNCGQDRLAGLPRTFKQMALAFFKIIIYDKAWNTAVKLLFNPGFLSTEYRERRLAPYTQPFKMFWVMVLAFTIAFSFNDTTSIKIKKRAENENIIPQKEKFEIENSEQTKNKLDVETKNPENEKVVGKTSDFFQYFPYFMLLIIPIFAKFLQVFFKKENYAFSIHLVFSIHLHTFSFLLITALTTLNKIVKEFSPQNEIILVIAQSLILLSIIIYSILAAIKFYNKRKKINTILKMVLIGLLYLATFTITLIIIIILTSIIFDYKEIYIGSYL